MLWWRSKEGLWTVICTIVFNNDREEKKCGRDENRENGKREQKAIIARSLAGRENRAGTLD